MDDIVRTRPAQKTAISDADITRRQEALRQADAISRIAAQARDPETDEIFAASVRGEIKVTDVIPLLKARRGLP
jgi:hypothetical protein